MNEQIPLFRTEADRDLFDQAYTKLLNTWPADHTSVYTSSRFGKTHVIVAGSPDAEPLVLVPGAQGTAAMWGPMIGSLINCRRVFCLDIIDQVGRSQLLQPLTSAEEATHWLEQTLDALKLGQVDLAGNSIGSFIAATYALNRRQRVRRLVLTAPAATVSDLKLSYILRVLLTMAIPHEGFKARFLRRSGADQVKPTSPLFELLTIAMSRSKIVSKLLPRALTDNELRKLDMPMFVVLGEKDPSSGAAPAAVSEKIGRLCPAGHTEVVAGAGHLWNDKQMRHVGDIVADFLANS